MKARRGYAVLLMMMVIAALTALIVIGLDHRTDDLDREHMTLCRAAARSAAESAVARMRGRFEAGGAASSKLEGTLANGPGRLRIRYSASSDGARVTAEGRCAPPGEARESIVHIRAELARRGGGWVYTDWRESGLE